jgi:hypothetical protein
MGLVLLGTIIIAGCLGEATAPPASPPTVDPPPPPRADARPADPPPAPPPAMPPPPPPAPPAPPPVEPDAGTPPGDAGGPATPPGPPMPTPPPGNAGQDPFGVRKIYPTVGGGREWFMPEDASRNDGEWSGANQVTRTDEAGVWRVQGSPRIAVTSPEGKAWFRNVEMTGYYRYRSTLPNASLTPGFQQYARGERHSANPVNATGVNQGRRPPPGTATWPGYPFTGAVNPHCLGSSYKGYMDINGAMDFKKEIAHVGGYTGARDSKRPFGGPVPTNQWVGFKVIIRNFDSNSSVQMESWLDPRGDGNWQKVNDVRDTGGWAGGANPDGCGGPPFNYRNDQIVNWAGPHVNWPFDFVSVDIKWLSAREVAPLP